MAKIISTGTATGKYDITQKDVREFTYRLFRNSSLNIEKMISVFDNSEVEQRHVSIDMDWFEKEHSFSERNAVYISEALRLSEKAINSCLENIGAEAGDIDHIIFVSSTGVSTPTIDAHLTNSLKLNRHISRTPLWGLGCAGGAAGISRAFEYTGFYPAKMALVIAVELCSLTFQKDDISKSNIVAASLFSDGAACVLIAGDENKYASAGRVRLKDSLSTIYSDSTDVMGWDVNEGGFKVIFSRDIPTIVKELVRPNITELADQNKMEIKDFVYFITHPGGMKVIKAYEESLGLPNGTLDFSRKILREHGNMSSSSVIFVLDAFLKDGNFEPGKYGLLSALGPGFSSELVLFRTE